MRNAESLPRTPSGQQWLCRVLLLAVLACNAVGLWPELAVSRVDLNDNVSHFAMVERMVQAGERGENPLDCWSPEWSFGYPMLRVYQTLPHGMVAAAYALLGKTVPLMTVFVWVRFLAVVLLPLSFFGAARLLHLGPAVAAAAALLAPLISTSGLYGLEFGSYVWVGSWLFPQAVATHFLLLTLGFAFRALRAGKRLQLAGVFLGLTFLCHFIYGYIGAISICLLAGDARIPSARAAHPADRMGSRNRVSAGGIPTGAVVPGRRMDQSQPLGAGVEMGFLRRRPGCAMAGHGGIAVVGYFGISSAVTM